MQHATCILEVECNMVRNMALNLCKESQSTTSKYRSLDNLVKGNRIEEERLHQLIEPMNLEQKNSLPSDVGQDEPKKNQVSIDTNVL